MNVLQTVLTVFLAMLGNATVLAVVGYLAKSFLERLMIRDMKVFESELKAKTDAQIERLRNEMTRNVESYKVQLRKSEVFFQRELDAASAFASLFQSIEPRYNHPDMDWYDACDQIAILFDNIENELREFAIKHAAVLTDGENDLLDEATGIAGQWKFHALPGQVAPQANEKADELYNKVKALKHQLMERVRAQSSD